VAGQAAAVHVEGSGCRLQVKGGAGEYAAVCRQRSAPHASVRSMLLFGGAKPVIRQANKTAVAQIRVRSTAMLSVRR